MSSALSPCAMACTDTCTGATTDTCIAVFVDTTCNVGPHTYCILVVVRDVDLETSNDTSTQAHNLRVGGLALPKGAANNGVRTDSVGIRIVPCCTSMSCAASKNATATDTRAGHGTDNQADPSIDYSDKVDT